MAAPFEILPIFPFPFPGPLSEGNCLPLWDWLEGLERQPLGAHDVTHRGSHWFETADFTQQQPRKNCLVFPPETNQQKWRLSRR